MDKGRAALIAGMFLGIIIGKVSFKLLEYIVKMLFDNILIQLFAYMIGIMLILVIFILLLKLLRFVIERN